jgi:predicted PurR-regulated permease PerM
MTDRAEVTLWQIVEAAAVVLVLGLFLFQAQAVLNPLLLFLLLWAVLIPFRGKPGHTPLLSVAGALTLIWLLAATGTLLAPFVLAAVLAYVLDPLADKIEGRGVGRSLAVMLLMVPAVGLLIVGFFVMLPMAIRQLGEVVQATPELIDRVAVWIEQSEERLLRFELPFIDLAAIVEQLRGIDSAAVVSFFQERQAALASWIWTGVLGLGRGIGSVLTILGYIALTPVLAFYLIRDWDRITDAVTDLVPENMRSTVVAYAKECDGLVSSYLRGQVTVAITMGVITGIGLAIVSFPYAATLGLIVAIFSVIPYLGLILSLIPAIVIALVSGSVATSLVKVAAVYGIAQILDGTVITPRIVGDSVGMHPVWVVLALVLGGFFFGFAGLLIGVPAAAVARLLIVQGLERYRASNFYRGREASAVQ